MTGWGSVLGLLCAGLMSVSGTCLSSGAPLTETKSVQVSVEMTADTDSELMEEIGEELWDKLELERLDDMVAELLPGGRIKFTDVVIQIITGQTDGIGKALLGYVKERVGYELLECRANLIQLLFLAAIGGIFTQLAVGFGSFTVSETGFHVTYLMMFGLLMSSFGLAYQLVSSAIGAMIRLLQAALPILFVSVAFSGKITTSAVFSEMATLMIAGVEWMGQMVLLPGTKLFLLLILADNLVPGAMFAKLSGLVKTVVEWGAKTAFGLVMGMNMIKGICVPVRDTLSSGTVTKVLSAIPGIGNSVDSVAGLVLGTAKLIRNGIGVTAMLCLVLVGAIPMLKLALITLLHYGTAALVEPIADKRLTGALAGAAEAIYLLLKLLLMTMCLFFLTVALICSVAG